MAASAATARSFSCALQHAHAELRSRRSCTSSRDRRRACARVKPLNSAAGSVISSSTTGSPPILEHAPQDDHRIARLRARAGARCRATPCRAARRAGGSPGTRRSPSSRRMRRKRKSDARLLGVRRDERALALPAHDEVVGGQRVDRLAHRALRHAEARGELDLARDRLAGPPLARVEARSSSVLDLQVERLERTALALSDGRWRIGDRARLIMRRRREPVQTNAMMSYIRYLTSIDAVDSLRRPVRRRHLSPAARHRGMSPRQRNPTAACKRSDASRIPAVQESLDEEARPRRRHRRRRPDRLQPAVPHRHRRNARPGPAGHPAVARAARSTRRRPRSRA